MATENRTHSSPVPSPRRELTSATATEYPTGPLNADAAAALERLSRRIFGVSEVA